LLRSHFQGLVDLDEHLRDLATGIRVRLEVQNPRAMASPPWPSPKSSMTGKSAAPLAFAGGAAVAGSTVVPPRGVEQPADSGRETRNPPAPGTESGTPGADPLPELLALVVELPPEAAALLLKIARRLRQRPS
jgi:hypothetical protein